MALLTNAHSTYTAKGLREDLTDVIYDISPTETPFMSNAARVNVSAKVHEWQTDSLAAAAANAQLEGNIISAAAITATNRLKNPTQISYKAFAVTGTTEAVDKAGRASEVSYQTAKHGRELKRDMEKDLTGATGTDLGGTGSARTFGGVEAWISTNGTELGTAGTSPGYQTGTGLVTAVTDSSAVTALVESRLKTAIKEAWTAGGEPGIIMVGPVNKQAVSGFSGIGTLYQDVTRRGTESQAAIIGGADLYISDFGRHVVVPNRFSRDRTALVLDMSYWAVGFLRPMHTFEIGKRGDADEMVVLTEYTLESRNEAASAKVANLSA
jgi:hypothetical protein